MERRLVKKLVIVRTITLLDEVSYSPEYYDGMSLEEAIKWEESNHDGDHDWMEIVYNSNGDNLKVNTLVKVIETAEDTEGEKGND